MSTLLPDLSPVLSRISAHFSSSDSPGAAVSRQRSIPSQTYSSASTRVATPASNKLPIRSIDLDEKRARRSLEKGEGDRERSAKGDAEREDELGGQLPEDEEEEWTYPDGGRGWIVVLGCFIYAGSTMGWGLVWGVFQTNYKANVFPDTSESILTLIGGLSAFTMTGTSFVAGRLGDRFGYKRMLIIANTISFASFLLSSFCNKLWQIFVVQGFLVGFGLGLSMPLYMALPSQWFLKKRGLATGIAVSGSGFFGGANTIFVRLLIVRLGYKHTLLIFTFILSACWVGAFLLVEARPPPRLIGVDGKHLHRPWLPKGCWKDPVFYSLISCIFIATFGFLTPYFFITSYTKAQIPSLSNSTSLKVTVPLLVMNISGAVGRIVAGVAADRVGPVNCFTLSLFIGGLVQICMWQFAHTYPTILGFSVLYGMFGSMWLSLLPVVSAQLFGIHDLATLTGFAVLVNSPGQFAGSTIAGSIRSATGGSWPAMICFSGGCTVLGSLCMGYARFKGERRVWAAY